MSILGLSSRIHKRDHDVSCALGDQQALVVVRQSARMHQQPPRLSVAHGAVVPNETTPTAFEVHF